MFEVGRKTISEARPRLMRDALNSKEAGVIWEEEDKMKDLKVIGILIAVAGGAVAAIGGLLAGCAGNIPQCIIAGLVALIGGLIAGIGGRVSRISSEKS